MYIDVDMIVVYNNIIYILNRWYGDIYMMKVMVMIVTRVSLVSWHCVQSAEHM